MWHMYQRVEGEREERESQSESERKRLSVVIDLESGVNLVPFTFSWPESEVNSFILQIKLSFFSNLPE